MTLLNAKIAEHLGWQSTKRSIETWSYLGNRPFKMPMPVTVWIAPDGKEQLTLPDWENNEDAALALVRSLSPEDQREWCLLYMGIGWLAEDSEPYSGVVCKAWVALKDKQKHEREANDQA